jgi:hypothetical protein
MNQLKKVVFLGLVVLLLFMTFGAFATASSLSKLNNPVIIDPAKYQTNVIQLYGAKTSNPGGGCKPNKPC